MPQEEELLLIPVAVKLRSRGKAPEGQAMKEERLILLTVTNSYWQELAS